MLRHFATWILALLAAISGAIKPTSLQAQTDSDRDKVHLIVLSNTHVPLTEIKLREKLNELFPGQFLPSREDNFVIDGNLEGEFLVQSNIPKAAGIFLLHAIPDSYLGLFPEAAKSIAERGLSDKAVAQCCFLAIYPLRAHTTHEDTYRFMALVLGKLAPADAAVLIEAVAETAIEFDDGIRARLARGEKIPQLR